MVYRTSAPPLITRASDLPADPGDVPRSAGAVPRVRTAGVRGQLRSRETGAAVARIGGPL